MVTNPHHIDPTEYLHELLTQASPDLMRTMLTDFINLVLSAQADTICGAGYHTVSHNEPTNATVTATCYLKGVSTRWMNDLVAISFNDNGVVDVATSTGQGDPRMVTYP